MPLKIVISLALCHIQKLLNPVSLPEPPRPYNIKIAHHAAHITIGDEQEEHIINKPQEVERKVWVRALPVRDNPEGDGVGKVSGGEHVDHESNVELLSYTGEVLAFGLVIGVFLGEMSDHDPKQSVESTANNTGDCR